MALTLHNKHFPYTLIRFQFASFQAGAKWYRLTVLTMIASKLHFLCIWWAWMMGVCLRRLCYWGKCTIINIENILKCSKRTVEYMKGNKLNTVTFWRELFQGHNAEKVLNEPQYDILVSVFILFIHMSWLAFLTNIIHTISVVRFLAQFQNILKLGALSSCTY